MKRGQVEWRDQMLCMDPEALKEVLTKNFLASSVDFYSKQAEETIRRQLERLRGIGPVTAYNIYMRAVNGTYKGPAMSGPFAKHP